MENVDLKQQKVPAVRWEGQMGRAALKGSEWLGPGDFLNAVKPGSSRGAGKWIWGLSLMSDDSAGPGGGSGEK